MLEIRKIKGDKLYLALVLVDEKKLELYSYKKDNLISLEDFLIGYKTSYFQDDNNKIIKVKVDENPKLFFDNAEKILLKYNVYEQNYLTTNDYKELKESNKINILSIGDIHGRPVWEDIDVKKYDKIIFTGDYLDIYDEKGITEETALDNFKNIIDFGKSNRKKVRFLLGNHDIHYIFYKTKYFEQIYAGRLQLENIDEIVKLYKKNLHLFSVAYQKGDYLFTHAGLTNSIYNEYFSDIPKRELGSKLNIRFFSFNEDALKPFLLIGKYRGGKNECGSLFWADKTETETDYLDDIHQIVGHSKVKKITTIGDKTSSITYIDCLEFKKEFYEKKI